jgi:glycine dehydrogenase subunit 1
MKPYSHLLPNSDDADREKMLKALGVNNIDELYRDVPADAYAKSPIKMPGPYTEMEIERLVGQKLAADVDVPPSLCFLGGGAWPHYVPAAVQLITSRSEFYTSYTPYQPEASQGMLQALFEYQSLICDLTKMDAANASMYDWATASAEAALMAIRVTGRKGIVVCRAAGHDRRGAVRTYVEAAGGHVSEAAFDPRTGLTDLGSLSSLVGDDTAAIYVEQPNFLGCVEEAIPEIAGIAHSKKALLVVGVEPTSLGLLKAPGEYGADIVVGEGQPLGIPLSYGGPLLGIFAAKGDLGFIRQMPGRIVGETTEKGSSRRGYVLVLQSREQHIRRERATSNICTNQALMAVAAAAYLSLLGGDGLKALSKTIYSNAHYAARRVAEVKGFSAPLFESRFYSEFALQHALPGVTSSRLFEKLGEQGVLASLPLRWFYPELPRPGLVSVTEVHMKQDIDRLVDALGRAV